VLKTRNKPYTTTLAPINDNLSIQITPMKSLLKHLFNIITPTPREKLPNMAPLLESENKWLNPKDNFGVLERGKAWSKD